MGAQDRGPPFPRRPEQSRARQLSPRAFELAVKESKPTTFGWGSDVAVRQYLDAHLPPFQKPRSHEEVGFQAQAKAAEKSGLNRDLFDVHHFDYVRID